MRSATPAHLEKELGSGATTELAREGLAELRALAPADACWAAIDSLARSVLPQVLDRLALSRPLVGDLDRFQRVTSVANALRELEPLPKSLVELALVRQQRLPDPAAKLIAAFGAVLEASDETARMRRLRDFLDASELLTPTLEAVACARRRVPRARLVFDNLAPQQIRFVGLSAENTIELSPRKATVIGRSSEADVQVIGVMIGGRKNCTIAWDARGPHWTIAHLGHSCPVLVNGEDIARHRVVPLRDGDCIDPILEREGPRFLIRFVQEP